MFFAWNREHSHKSYFNNNLLWHWPSKKVFFDQIFFQSKNCEPKSRHILCSFWTKNGLIDMWHIWTKRIFFIESVFKYILFTCEHTLTTFIATWMTWWWNWYTRICVLIFVVIFGKFLSQVLNLLLIFFSNQILNAAPPD